MAEGRAAGERTAGGAPVGVVVLNYENAEDTGPCLDRLTAVEYPDLRVYLVDNASSPECRRELAAVVARHPEVRFIQNDRNLGYAAGNNVGIRQALEDGAEYVLILNNDALVTRDFLGPLVALMEREPDVAIAVPHWVDDEGNDVTPLRERPSLSTYIGRFGVIAELRNRRRPRRRGPAPRSGAVEMEVPLGACLLLRRSFLEDIGLLDEGTFLFHEEFILAEQARRRNQRIVLSYDSAVRHLRHRSTSKRPLLWSKKILWRSQNYYLREYRGVGVIGRGSVIGYQMLSYFLWQVALAPARSLWRRVRR